MMNETAQQNMENHPVIRDSLRPRGWSPRVYFHPTRTDPRLWFTGIILLNYLIIKPSAKEPSNTHSVRVFGKELLFFFFFLKYGSGCVTLLFLKVVSVVGPVNKEDALPAQVCRRSCCQAPQLPLLLRMLSCSKVVQNSHHSLKVADSCLKAKHNQLLYSVAYGNYKIVDCRPQVFAEKATFGCLILNTQFQTFWCLLVASTSIFGALGQSYSLGRILVPCCCC